MKSMSVGGTEIQQSCRQQIEGKEKFVGALIETEAGKLAFKSIIHVSVPTWSGGDSHEEELLTSIVYDCLELAHSRGYKTIVFPALGSERFGTPSHIVARTLIGTVKRYVLQNCNACNIGNFIICINSESDLTTFQKELSNGFGSISYSKKGTSSDITDICFISVVLAFTHKGACGSSYIDKEEKV